MYDWVLNRHYEYDWNREKEIVVWRRWLPPKDVPRYEGIILLKGYDNRYDGLIEAHNDSFFVTQAFEVYSREDIEKGDTHWSHHSRIFYAYKLDDTLERLMKILDISYEGVCGSVCSGRISTAKHEALMAARSHADLLKPSFWLDEGQYAMEGWASDLERHKKQLERERKRNNYVY